MSLLVRSEMDIDPRVKSIFIFCRRNKKRVTAIVMDRNGWHALLKTTDLNSTPLYRLSYEQHKYSRFLWLIGRHRGDTAGWVHFAFGVGHRCVCERPLGTGKRPPQIEGF